MDVLYVTTVLMLVSWVILRHRMRAWLRLERTTSGGPRAPRVLVASTLVGLTAIAPTVGSNAAAAPANATFTVGVTPVAGTAVRTKYKEGEPFGYLVKEYGNFTVVGNKIYAYNSAGTQLIEVNGLTPASPVHILWEGSSDSPCPMTGSSAQPFCYVEHIDADANGNVYLLVYGTVDGQIAKFDPKTKSFTALTTSSDLINPSNHPQFDVASDGTVAFYLGVGGSCGPDRKTAVTTVSPAGVRATRTYPFDVWSFAISGLGKQYAIGRTTCSAPGPSLYSLDGPAFILESTPPAGTYYYDLASGKQDVYIESRKSNAATVDWLAADDLAVVWAGQPAGYGGWFVGGDRDQYLVGRANLATTSRDGKVTVPSTVDFNVVGTRNEIVFWNHSYGDSESDYSVRKDGTIFSSATSPSFNVDGGVYTLASNAEKATYVGSRPINNIGFDSTGRLLATSYTQILALDRSVWTPLYGLNPLPNNDCPKLAEGSASVAKFCFVDARVRANGTINFVNLGSSTLGYNFQYGAITNGQIKLYGPSLAVGSDNHHFKVGGDGSAVEVVTNETTNAGYVFGQSEFKVTQPNGVQWTSKVDSGFPAGYTTDANGTLYAVMRYQTSNTAWTYKLLVARGSYYAAAALPSFNNGEVNGINYGDDGQLYISSRAGLYKFSNALARYIDLPPVPTWKDDPKVAGDAKYVKPADTADLSWKINADKSITATVIPATTFLKSSGAKSGIADAQELSVVASVTPVVADTARSVTFPPQGDTSPPVSTVIPVPSAPSVTDDPLVKGDAKYVLPPSTSTLSWVANPDGSVRVTVIAANTRFADGSLSITFGAPIDVYTPPTSTTAPPTTVPPTTVAPTTVAPTTVAPTTVAPPTTVAMETNVPVTGGGGVGLLPIAVLLLACGGTMTLGVRARRS